MPHPPRHRSPWAARSGRVLRWALAVLALPVAALAQVVPDYRLDLDTGGHRAAIRGLAVSADGAVLVSVSDDKTARVWDWQRGESTAILRGQIGGGNEGLIHAVALSPDGRFAAVAGYFGGHVAAQGPFGDVRVFDTRSGRLLRVLEGHDLMVEALAYDPARDELAASGQGGMIHRWRAPFGDAPEPLDALDAEANRVRALAYAAGGTRLAAATLDYGLRLWDLATGAALEIPDAEPLWDVPLVGLAVSADGMRLAVAGDDGRVELRDARDGRLVAALPVQPFRPDALAFAGGDRLLTVSCGYRCGEDHRSATWSLDTLTPVADYRGHDAEVRAALALPGGEIVATAGGRGHEIHLWRAGTGAAVRQLKGLGQSIAAVGIAGDGSAVAWGTVDPCPDRVICPQTLGPLDRMLPLPGPDRSLSAPRAIEGDFLRAVLDMPGLAVTIAGARDGGFEGADLRLTGPGGPQTLRRDATTGYYHTAYTLTGDTAITGGGNGILLAQALADGRMAGEFRGHTGDILALAALPRANRLISGSADQTLRIWNLDTRALIASVFTAGPDWIVWTPQGYYQSSPEGDRLVGWHVNQGQGREARFIRARQLRQHLHSPEIVRRALMTGDPAGAVRDLRGTDRELDTLLTRAAPEFDLRLAPDIAAPEGFAAIEVTGASLEEVESWGYSVLVNDRRVPPLRVADAGGRLIYHIALEPGENRILVTGQNDYGYVTERSAVALFNAPVEPKAGKLFVAVIGVNDYPNLPEGCNGRSCNLDFPVADALEFLDVVRERTAPLFQGMEVRVMVSRDALDKQPLRRDRLAALIDPAAVMEPEARTITDELTDFLALPGPDDTTVIFAAGHGINIDEHYYLIPADGQKRGEDWRRSSLVDWSVIQEEIGFAQGRRILVLDTCHAANAFNARLEKDAADARVVVFSATAANNTAAERADLGHGIFTWALVEGLRGKADPSGEGVRLLNLADYVYREVVRLSSQKQEPFYHISQTSNFLLARP